MWVLQAAYYVYRQQYGTSARHGSFHDQMRHTAYCQLVRWCWQWLGRNNRVVLPACAVAKIRETFPSNENYVGFEL
uniref:P2X purinoreceptor 7 intracellular domain-containing protein n=1 Tax=Amphimedon queenslandica TaxID=400682 RepID=A0A1X7TXJ4_AMPQE